MKCTVTDRGRGKAIASGEDEGRGKAIASGEDEGRGKAIASGEDEGRGKAIAKKLTHHWTLRHDKSPTDCGAEISIVT
jgi:hypothetical protein